jgi:hypothetical protein
MLREILAKRQVDRHLAGSDTLKSCPNRSHQREIFETAAYVCVELWILGRKRRHVGSLFGDDDVIKPLGVRISLLLTESCRSISHASFERREVRYLARMAADRL